jgi:DNA-binding transcriptional ArsR family regulator
MIIYMGNKRNQVEFGPRVDDQDFLELVASRFRALGEPNRLRILASLEKKELSVQQIVDETCLSQPNVSRHLKALCSIGLLKRRKDGQQAFYSVGFPQVFELCHAICGQTEKELKGMIKIFGRNK